MNPMQRGDLSAAVTDLQHRLESLGYEIAAGERGGKFGESTESAVRALQQKRGLDVDGIVGPSTWRELVEASWALGSRLLYLRESPMRGDDIRELQSRLNSLGFSSGKHDGIFGPVTAAALREFQRNLIIEEDGIVGRQTVRALERLRLVTRQGLGPRIRERTSREAEPRGLEGKRLAIDPGHGGGDTGARGPSGESEAELAFHLAAAAAVVLDRRGAVSILTRGPHGDATESDRAKIANEFGANLLISIHLNSYTSEAAKGAASYYFEHDGVASEPGEHLADLMLASITRDVGLRDCRAHGKNYPILRETVMPAVVIEPCFITNPEEAKLAADAGPSSKLVAAIVAGIEEYFS